MTNPASLTTDTQGQSDAQRRAAPDSPALPRAPLYLVVLVPLLIFLPTLFNDFTNWDDPDTITNNPRLNFSNLSHYWRNHEGGLWVPMTYTTWIALASISHSPWVFHIASLLFHVASSASVFLILRRLVQSDTSWPEFLGAMLFALHPLQVEPVAWASGLKDVAAGACALAAVNQHMHPGWRRQVIATALFAVAMLYKPSAATAIGIAGAIDLLIAGRPTRALTLLPWLALVLPILVVAHHAQETRGIPWLPIPQRLLVASDALAFYVFKLIAPVHLAMDYGRITRAVLGAGGAARVTWIVPLALAVVLLMARSRVLQAAALVFVVGLSINLGLVPFQFQFYSTVADHYAYLAMLGPALAAAWLVSHRPTRFVYVVGSVLLVAMCVQTIRQQRVWKDSVTLFTRAVAVNPESPGAHNNLGTALGARGDLNGAQRHLLEALRLAPYDSLARRSLAVLHVKMDDLDGAIAYLAESIQLNERARQDVTNDRRELARLIALRDSRRRTSTRPADR